MKTSFNFSLEQFNNLFPFYILFNRNLEIVSVGHSITKIYPCSTGDKFNEHFSIPRPYTPIASFEDLLVLQNQMLVIQPVIAELPKIRGQFELLKDTDEILFVGSPWFASMDQVSQHRLTINDFARHDPLIDLLHVLKSQELTTEDLRQLISRINIQSAELKQAYDKISDIALFSMQDPDPIVRVDKLGNIMQMNPASSNLRVFEYDNTSFGIYELFKKVIPEIDSDDTHWRFETKADGKDYSFICVYLPEQEYFNVYGRDISKIRETETKLKESDELWQFALEGAGDGVWEYNFATKESFFSRQYKQMLGYEEDEFRNDFREWISRIHPDDLHIVRETDQLYHEKKIQSHNREYRIRHKKGNYIWVLDRGMLINPKPGAPPTRIIGTHTDITERKLHEQTLKSNEEKYRGIIANMNLGLVESNEEGVILYANHCFCKMSGYQLYEIKGKKTSFLLNSGQDKKVSLLPNTFPGNWDAEVEEVSIKNKKGELRWWLISSAPQYNESGEWVGSIGIYLDITAQKQVEADLQEARLVAEQSTKAKEEFLANMSHEIRTPMNAILGMGRQLGKTKLDADQDLYLKSINEAAKHLLVVINDILDISKIEAGKLTLESIPFNIANLINQCIQIMSLRADEKGICLIQKTQTQNCPTLLGDPYRITQILLNLMSNAIKFTEKGNVTIDWSLTKLSEESSLLSIKVIDTGIGMSKDFVDKLFEKFLQEDKTTARKYGGTGLGMAICRQLIQLMEGKVTVASEKNLGTEVAVSIPLKNSSESELNTIVRPIADSSVIKDSKILLVEDNEMNRLVATTILGPYGPTITEVTNGEEAIKAIQAHSYDLVLMDIQMPVMNGYEASAFVRKNLRSAVPIIALTANAIKGETEKCLAVGMNDYLSKPFEEEDLVNLISKWLTSTKVSEGKI